MATHYRTQGFILKKDDRGEANQVFTIYTKDFGKLEILGKAIRKISSKLRSGTEIFYLSEIRFIQGKTQKTLTDAIVIDKFENVRNNLRKLKITHKIAEVFDELVHGQEKDENLWQLLSEVFDKLNNLQFKIYNLQLVYFYFFWNLVSILGYQPEFYECSLNGKKINCDVIKILKVILIKDWQILSRLKIEPRHLKLLKDASEWYNKSIQ